MCEANLAKQFPPRYAGMEGGECCIYPASAGMEVWLVFDMDRPSGSPAYRGDGRDADAVRPTENRTGDRSTLGLGAPDP